MANIRKRNKSYEITVSCGYGIDGRQIRRTMTYTPEKGMTAKQIEKEVQRQAVLFEEQCRDGVVGTDGRMNLLTMYPCTSKTQSTDFHPLSMKNTAVCLKSA